LTRRYLSLGASLYIFIDYPALLRSKNIAQNSLPIKSN
jgi:hypothetical protein